MVHPAVLTAVCGLVSVWPAAVHSAVVTLGTFTQCVSSTAECTSSNLSEGQYPLCSDCAQFVKCTAANSALFTCGPGTVYDVSLGVCNFPSVAVCGTRTSTATATTSTTTFPTLPVFQQCVSTVEQCVNDNLTTGQYPSCSDCGSFFKCNGAEGSGVISCDAGLHYDVNRGVCDFIASAVCGTNTTNGQSLPLFRQCVSTVEQCVNDNLTTGQYPSCSDCGSFFKCNGAGGSDVISCSAGLHYDVNLGVCTSPGDAECGATVTP